MNDERIKSKADELINTQGIDPQVALRIAEDIDKSMDIEFKESKAKTEKLKKQKNTLVAGLVIASVFAVFFGASFLLESANPQNKVKWVLISEIDEKNALENLVKMKIPGTSDNAILTVIGDSNENPETKLELSQSQLEVGEFLAIPEGAPADAKPTKFKITQNKDGKIAVEYYDVNNKKNSGEFEIQENNSLDQISTDIISFSAIPDGQKDAVPVDFVIVKNKDGSISARSVDKDGKTKEFEFRIKDK